MADLSNGQSEISTVTLSLPNYQKEIKNWKNYRLSGNFLQPCEQFSFTVSGFTKDDIVTYKQLLVPGAPVQLKIDNKIQFTGFIDNRNIRYVANGGIEVTVTGRDILSRLVNSSAPPRIKLQSKMTVADLLAKFCNDPFSLGTLYNAEDAHINIITGRHANENQFTTISFTSQDTQADGSVKTSQITEIIYNRKPGLQKIDLKKMHSQCNEGAYAFVDKLLRRVGLIVKAVADGSGIMAVSPTYDGPSYGRITMKPGDARNNVLSCDNVIDWAAQPSVIIAEGFGGGREFGKSPIQAIMVNEITGLDANGNYLPVIEELKKVYKKANVVPLRKELIPVVPYLNTQRAYCPMYIKDDESKTMEELTFAITRRLTQLQMRANTLTYTLIGHTNEKGEPWAINTSIDVDDDILDIHQRMWIIGREFRKSPTEGTVTTLHLIQPHTLRLG